jgi:SPOR domain
MLPTKVWLMTPSLLIRPVLAIAMTAILGACGMVESDPHRFENLADRIAAVPLDGQAAATVAPPSFQSAKPDGLRPALRVEVMDPHALWDARDGMLQQASTQVAERAAPLMVDAVVREASDRLGAAPAQLRPAMAVLPQPADTAPLAQPAPTARALVQLGAYSSERAARSAWARLKSGGAAWALDGLTPTFEAVQVNGRELVRLKVRAPGAGAAAVCAAAGIDDPWCRRSA